jgi:hypothetical protein
MRNITYNGYNLQTSSIQTQFIGELSTADYIENNLHQRAISDGEKISDRRYSARDLEIQCNILGNSIDDVEDKIDELKQALFGVLEGELVVAYGGENRVFRSSCVSFQPNGTFGYGLRRGFSIVFRALDGFSTGTIQNILLEGATASPIEETVDLDGSLASQKPTILITVNSATDLAVLSIKNDTTNSEMIIQQPLVAGDELLINTDRFDVKLNGVSGNVLLLGIFPVFFSGLNDLVITPTSTAHNLDIIIGNKPRYL